MNRKVALLLVVLLLALGVGTVMAKGGPHEKATGGIWIDFSGYGVGGEAYASFNAHETDPAKGELHWTRWNDAGEMVNEWSMSVDEVEVDGEWAVFSGWTDRPDSYQYFCVYVYDGGTPGRNGDMFAYEWHECTDNWTYRDITGGNLVVHTK